MTVLTCAVARRSFDAPAPLGVTLDEEGAEFTVFAGSATRVQVCLFDHEGEDRVDLIPHALGRWSGHIAGVREGQRYGIRADGPWAPGDGHRYNPDKLLLDPYGLAIEGQVSWRPEVFGFTADDQLRGDDSVRDDRDSAEAMPRNVVLRRDFDWDGDAPPRVPWDRTVIYEAHVRGLTMLNPAVPEYLRGTYAGVANEATISHLRRLGVTAVELLPVHASASEPAVARRGLVNYWGYNTLGFFAPEPRYAAATDPQGVIDEFKGMVKALHAAGIEVILDVVYNHTAEQSAAEGATLSWRGLDNAHYYRLDERGADVDVTGCGNTVDICQPATMQMVLDSLRYWVTDMHVDGFRFDLAVALGRGTGDAFHADHPFFLAMRTDPVLQGVKLIAEPWDLGGHGWRTGQFPPPFTDWNDRFRDAVRTFWLTDVAAAAHGHSGHGVGDLATRIAGSRDLFGSRSPQASINFITAHDGFTMADLTAYDLKHNGANGEGNRDGTTNNLSWNFGVEGHERASAEVETARRRTQRNLLATLLISSGVPMIVGGDEVARSQGGNNNPYCQDNPISWVDWQWTSWQEDLLATTSFLTGLRERFPVLRQRVFFPGDPIDGDEFADLHWHSRSGLLMTMHEWQDGNTRTVQVVFDGTDVGDEQLLLVLHGGAGDEVIQLPRAQRIGGWDLLWDSAFERPDQVPTRTVGIGGDYSVKASSVAIFRGSSAPAADLTS